MDDEKLLPLGELAPQTPSPSNFHLENKLNSSPASVIPEKPTTSIPKPFVPAPDLQKSSLPGVPSPAPGIPKLVVPPPSAPVAPEKPVMNIPKLIVPPPFVPAPDLRKPALPGVPSPAQQSWGVVISIVIIVLMIIIGAFYAWGQRIAQNQPPATAQ